MKKIGSRVDFCVYTRASNSDLCQIWAKYQLFSASVNAALMSHETIFCISPQERAIQHLKRKFAFPIIYISAYASQIHLSILDDALSGVRKYLCN